MGIESEETGHDVRDRLTLTDAIMRTAEFLSGAHMRTRFCLKLGIVLSVFLIVALAAALDDPFPADVTLKDGTKLRGLVVSESAEEVVIRNDAGEFRLRRASIDRIERIGAKPPASGPADKPGRVGKPDSRPTTQPDGEAGDEADGEAGFPAPPLLTPRDILRIKLHELRVDGEPEPLRVRFLARGTQKDLPAEVLDELRRRKDYDPEWEETLLHGEPAAKLQLIVSATGARHVERIELAGDPEVLSTFRRRILPMVVAGCARSGCHRGEDSAVFRFPRGGQTTEAWAYTAFALLDGMPTSQGPLINRESPTESALLKYLLGEIRPGADAPGEGGPRIGHPAPPRGRKLHPQIRSETDPKFEIVLRWLTTLRSPHPPYGLDYKMPTFGQATTQPAMSAPASAPAASQPGSHPQSP